MIKRDLLPILLGVLVLAAALTWTNHRHAETRAAMYRNPLLHTNN